MRRLFFIVFLSAATVWAADWPSQSGNPQRDGWAQGEEEVVKSAIPDLRLLYKHKVENESRGLNSLTSPLILGNLITYKGFKEMLFVGASSDTIYSIDAALNEPLWKAHFDYKGDQAQQTSPTAGCPGGLTATPADVGSSGPLRRVFSFRRSSRPAAPGGVFATGFGRNGYVFAIGSDGYLRFVRQSDGNDTAVPPVKFLPANANVSSINVNGTMVYAATVNGCGGSGNALYAIDLGGDGKQVVSFPTNGSGLAGIGGTAVGENGTVYAQVASGHGDVAGDYNNTVLALNPTDLKVKDYFTPSGGGAAADQKDDSSYAGITPTVFSWKGKDLVVAGRPDGTVYLLDSSALGGSDHHTALCHTEPILKSKDSVLSGNFATWEDEATHTRWIYAAVRGATNGKFPRKKGSAKDGSIVAYKLEENDGKFSLAPQWISRNLTGPASPITANGLVFALSSGVADAAQNKTKGHATMYILDGATGKELFSSGNDAATFSHNSGLALANGRIYFTTHDNTIYCYGIPAMQPQLMER